MHISLNNPGNRDSIVVTTSTAPAGSAPRNDVTNPHTSHTSYIRLNVGSTRATVVDVIEEGDEGHSESSMNGAEGNMSEARNSFENPAAADSRQEEPEPEGRKGGKKKLASGHREGQSRVVDVTADDGDDSAWYDIQPDGASSQASTAHRGSERAHTSQGHFWMGYDPQTVPTSAIYANGAVPIFDRYGKPIGFQYYARYAQTEAWQHASDGSAYVHYNPYPQFGYAGNVAHAARSWASSSGVNEAISRTNINSGNTTVTTISNSNNNYGEVIYLDGASRPKRRTHNRH